MVTAIEGDIDTAYDSVHKKKLPSLVGKRIKNKKFLELIERRLNYE